MKTALVINPHSLPQRSGLSRLNPFAKERFERRLAREIEEIIDDEVTVYLGAETIDEVPDRVVVYGGDGTVMRVYNRLLEMTGSAPPILLIGGGSGTYWTRNLGIQMMGRKKRIGLLRDGTVKSFPLIRVEYDGVMSPHDVRYVDSFGLGDLAAWIHEAETKKGEWGGSKRDTPLERATTIFLSYVLAGADYIAGVKREYRITTDEESATIHGAILPLVGLGIKIYSPKDGFAVQSTPLGPKAHLTTLIEMAGHVVGLGNEKTLRELEIATEGIVPMHFNGSPFTYEGKGIRLTYEPDKIRFFCP